MIAKSYVLLLAYILIPFLLKGTAAQGIKYNSEYSIACHNCYDPQYSTAIEDVLPFTRTIEIDIWDSEIYSGLFTTIAGGYRMDQDWYVKHEPQQKGNINCCGGTFKTCLQRLKTWSENNPGHEVITVFIDKKENWSESDEKRKPSDLDQMLLSVFPKSKIFTPADLQKDRHDLKSSVPDNWPDLDSLKGKFIFVITDGTINTTNRQPLNEYLQSERVNAVCFVAPEITNENEITHPNGISNENAPNVVFYNLKYSGRGLARNLNSSGYVSRVYGAPETVDSYNELVKDKVNFIALFNFKLNHH